jgi:hypothetical protein
VNQRFPNFAGVRPGRKRLLKQKLQGKLHLPRRLRLKDMVEGRRTDITVGQQNSGGEPQQQGSIHIQGKRSAGCTDEQ